MTHDLASPADRTSLNEAMDVIRADHARLRSLALAAAKQPHVSTDAALSLAEAVAAHEGIEARLFAQPFFTRPPESVRSSAARAQRRCVEFTTGNYHLPDPSAAAGLFVDALLAHLAAEDAWLNDEMSHQTERLYTIA